MSPRHAQDSEGGTTPAACITAFIRRSADAPMSAASAALRASASRSAARSACRRRPGGPRRKTFGTRSGPGGLGASTSSEAGSGEEEEPPEGEGGSGVAASNEGPSTEWAAEELALMRSARSCRVSPVGSSLPGVQAAARAPPCAASHAVAPPNSHSRASAGPAPSASPRPAGWGAPGACTSPGWQNA